jgi:hypothetical protein
VQAQLAQNSIEREVLSHCCNITSCSANKGYNPHLCFSAYNEAAPPQQFTTAQLHEVQQQLLLTDNC